MTGLNFLNFPSCCSPCGHRWLLQSPTSHPHARWKERKRDGACYQESKASLDLGRKLGNFSLDHSIQKFISWSSPIARGLTFGEKDFSRLVETHQDLSLGEECIATINKFGIVLTREKNSTE